MKKIISYLCLIICAIFAISSGIGVVSADSVNDDVKINAKSYILYHPDSKKVLASYNADEKTPVASICKLMTSLIVLENIENGTINLDDKVVASEYACMAEGSQAFLDAGSEYSIRDLLKSVIVASANDSAIVLAEAISGSEHLFVQKMNDKAKELGMHNTVYENATGLFTSGQHSTAEDTIKVLEAVSEYDIYNEDCHIWMDKLVHPSGRETELVNTNRLIRYYNHCLNGKTGYVDEAGYCLASTAMKNDMKLIAVILGCDKPQDRFEESVKLYSYGFANYKNEQVLFTNNPLGSIKVKGGKVETTQVYPTENYYAICKNGESIDVELNYEVPESIKAPLTSGTIIGRIIVTQNGTVLAEIPIEIREDLKKHNYSDALDKVISKWAL